MEYLIVHRGGRGQTFVYELAYQGKGDDGSPFVMNLLDAESLKTVEKRETAEEIQETKKTNKNPSASEKKSGVNGNLSGLEANLSGSNRGHIAPISGGIRGGENGYSEEVERDGEKIEENIQKRTYREPKNNVIPVLPDAIVPDNPPLATQSHVNHSQQS